MHREVRCAYMHMDVRCSQESSSFGQKPPCTAIKMRSITLHVNITILGVNICNIMYFISLNHII